MPGMTGLELQQRLVSTDPGLPVILITAHASDRSRQQALAAGASAFLNKPFEDRELLEAVERAIGGARPAGP
jgi:FixJ family two-component response regulator